VAVTPFHPKAPDTPSDVELHMHEKPRPSS
jgi:hypothetical protein